MDKEKKNNAQAGENNANELLRQLRAQYENEDASDAAADHPEEVFDAPRVLGVTDEEEDEVTRRIMEMFSAVESKENRAAQPASVPLVTPAADDTDIRNETVSLPDAERSRADDIEIGAEEKTTETVRDFEDEVSDTALPDYDDTLEEMLLTEPLPAELTPREDAVLSLPKEAEEDACEKTDAPTKPEEAIEAEQPEQIEQIEQIQSPEQLPADEVQQDISAEQEPNTAAEQEDEAAEEDDLARTVAMTLREDELLLDEFEELPPLPAAPSAPADEQAPPPDKKPTAERTDEADKPKQATPRPSPLDAALSAQRKKHESEKSKHSAELRAAESLSEEDLLLLLRMGYENDLRNQCSPQMLQSVEKEMNAEPLTERQKAHLAFGFRDAARTEKDEAAVKGDYSTQEYTQIKENYRKDGIVMVWRLVFTVLFAVCALAVDLLPLYGEYLPAPWSGIAHGAVAHLLGLQLLVLCAIPSLKRLWFGLRQLLRLSPEPISAVLPVLLCNVVYDVAMALQSTQYALLNFPTALLLLLCVIGESMELRREKIAFSVVSAAESKVVLHAVKPRKKKVVRGGEVVKIINDDADRTHYRVERAEHIDGYFYRTNAPTRRYRYLLPLLALQCLLALGVTGICTLKLGIGVQLLSVLMLTMQLCAPAVYASSFACSLLLTCKRLAPRNITVLGQSTVDEMAEDKMLIFDDTEMLQAKSSTEITVKGGGDPKRYVRYARRLFYALGGTLGKINTSDLSEDRMDGLVEILRVYPEGVEARLDGRVRALVGSSAFMVKNNIRVPNAGAEMAARKNEQSSILYLAFGGQIRLGYEINYRIHGSFEQTVAALCQGRNTVAISSYDPSITEEYLMQGRSAKKAPVRVIKPVRYEPKKVLPRASSGIVALKNTRAVAEALRACEQMSLNDRVCAAMQWVLCFAAALSAAVLTFAGAVSTLLSIVCALLIAVFGLPIWILSGRNICTDADHRQGRTTPKVRDKNKN